MGMKKLFSCLGGEIRREERIDPRVPVDRCACVPRAQHATMNPKFIVLVVVAVSSSWQFCDAFGPLVPVASRAATPRGASHRSLHGLQMGMQNVKMTVCKESISTDKSPPLFSQSGSKSACLKRKILAGAALLSVGVGTPQASRAADDVAKDAVAGVARVWFLVWCVCT